MVNLGTMMRNGSNPLSLNVDPTVLGGAFTLAAGSNYIAGGTMNLGAGSTVTFNGLLNSGGNLSINSGATLLTSGVSTINSGLTVQLGTATTLTAFTNTLTLGAGSIINSDATLSLGANATVTNGLLTFGTGGTMTTNATLTLGAGSVLANNFDPNAGATVTLTGGTISGGLSFISGGAATLTLNGNTGGAGVLNVVNTGTIGLANFLVNNTTPVGTITINAATTLSFASNPPLLTNGLLLNSATPLNINLSSSVLLSRLPIFQGSAPTTDGTAVKFLDGVLTNGGSISLLYLPAVQSLVGDPISIHISEFDTPGVHDKYVLQLSYDPAAVSALGEDPLDLYLGWLDPSDSTWKNAVDGNSDGGVSAHFVAGPYDPSVDFNLGYYGVDPTTSTVWAVVDHNSTFGVADPAPEPSTGVLLFGGLALLGRRSRKR